MNRYEVKLVIETADELDPGYMGEQIAAVLSDQDSEWSIIAVKPIEEGGE